MAQWLTTRLKVLLALAALAFVLFLWDSQQPRRPRTTGGGSPGSLPVRMPESPPAVQQLLAADPRAASRPVLSPEARRALEERSRGPWGRDPFALEAARPKGQVEVRPNFASGLHVSGIVWDAARTHAVINDSVVKVGDELDGIRIVAIQPDRVTVAKGDQRQILRLGE